MTLLDEESGVWHSYNEGAVSWAELRAAPRRWPASHRRPSSASGAFSLAAVRPFCALGSERGHWLPPLDDALSRYAQHEAPALPVSAALAAAAAANAGTAGTA